MMSPIPLLPHTWTIFMAREQSKSAKRRFNNGKFHNQYFVGRGIDIGAGADSLGQYMHVFRGMTQVDAWDTPQGDAQYMKGISDNKYDFVHSSHCLEHMENPFIALSTWIRITKPGGYLIVTVPEEYLYEHGMWPSRFNGDHKWSFSIGKTKHNMTPHINVMEMLQGYHNIDVHKIELIDDFFDSTIPSDQTRSVTTECSIEFIIKKLV